MKQVYSWSQQWVVSSLLIRIHEILNTSESTIMKFNYVLWFIQSHYNIGLEVQFAMSMRTTLTSNSYQAKYVWLMNLLILIYTYIIHNPLVRITTYFLTPLMLSVLILYMSGGTYSLKSTPNGRFLIKFSWQFYLFSEFLPEIFWEEIAYEIFVWISFC